MASSGNLLKAVFSPDGSQLLICGAKTRFRDLTTGKSMTLPRAGTIPSAAFSADGKRFLTGGEDGALRLWETRSLKEAGSPVTTGSAVSRVFLSGDGKKIASLGADNTLKLYSAGKGPLARARWARAATFSPDSALLLTASGPNAVLWDAVSGKELRTFKHGGAIASLLFSPDGKTLMTMGTNGTARLWNPATGDPIGNPLKHEGPALEAVFSPGGEALLTVYQNGGWQLWETRTGEAIGEEFVTGTSPWATTFAADGKRVLLLDKGGNLSRFDVSWMDPRMDAQQLSLASEVAGSCRVNAQGSVEPISTEEWSKLWRKYRKAAIP
jgi:WD40 repeat protein